mmetsp:Transcript_33677/g.78806  ORF Transcript_33677/g.78806 Transcript_33677/m.78806 type:complete len:259 (-) Transcript_33677:128-904(-)
MCTGMRMVRDWSAMARVMDWRIHQVAYVERRKPRAASYFSAALISPSDPSWIKSCSVRPWFMYFFAIETTRRRFAFTSSPFALRMRASSFAYSPIERPRSAASSAMVGSRARCSVSSSRWKSQCSSFWTALDSLVTSSGESRRCLPMLLRYQRIESAPLVGVTGASNADDGGRVFAEPCAVGSVEEAWRREPMTRSFGCSLVAPTIPWRTCATEAVQCCAAASAEEAPVRSSASTLQTTLRAAAGRWCCSVDTVGQLR